jgi:hypothetical protein
MSNTLLLKRSAVANAIPVSGNLALGELAINTNDGLLFTKIDNGVPAVIDLTKTQLTGDATGNRVGSTGALAVTLANTAVVPATYGNSTSIPSFTVDSKGRITSASENPISFSGSAITNGTSNVSVPTTNGNIILGVGGNTTGTITTTGANITGYINVTGNANLGNVGTTGVYTNNLYYANGTAWSFGGTPGGSNTQIQFNDGAGAFGASAAFTFNTASNVLTLGGNANVGNLGATNAVLAGALSGVTTISASGNANVGNIGGTNAVFTNIAGTLTTAAQTNITSVGTLGSLSVTGNISGGNLAVASAGTFGTTLAVTGNITGGNISTSGSGGNITGANVISSTTMTATGNVTGGNLITSGLLSVTGNANVGNIGATNIVGTLTTAAQTNITSVGNLSALNVNGAVGITGNINQTGNLNITGNVNVTGNLNYQNVTDLVVGDPLIFIGANNNANLFDLGIVEQWNDGTFQYGGFVRDASDGIFKVFGNVITEPTTTVNFTNAIYQPLKSGAFYATTGEFTGNVSVANLTSTLIGGTLSTAAQPNITSIGNLSLGNVGTATISTLANVTATTISTSTTSGALIVAGGVGVAGNVYATDLYKNGVTVLNANDTVDGGTY